MTAIVLGCATAGLYLFSIASEIGAFYSLDYGEGVVWWQSVHIDDFRLVYKRMDSYPYMVTHYPPVYHWVVRWVTGIIPDWLVAGRLVSLLATLGIGLVLGGLVYRTAPPKGPSLNRLAAAVAAGTLCLAVYPVLIWSKFARVDMLALLLMYSGLALFILSKRSMAGQYVAFVLFVLALYTKQTNVIAPFVCLLAAWVAQPARAAKLAGIGLLAGVPPLAWLMWATQGGFLLNIVGYNENPWDWDRLGNYFSFQALLAGAVVVPAMLLAVWAARRALRKGGFRAQVEGSLYRRAVAILVLYWLLAGLSTLGIAKVGGHYNYFLEFDIASCVLTGLLLTARLAVRHKRAWTLALAPQVALILVMLSISSSDLPTVALRKLHDRTYREVLAAVQQTPGDVYAEDISILIRSGKEPPAEAAIIVALAAAGAWDERPFLAMLEQQRFGALILPNLSFYSSGFSSAVQRRYEVARVTVLGTVYRPKPAGGDQPLWRQAN